MAEFCTHERHGGFCEKTETYCNLGACPYEDMKEYAPVVRCKNCKHYLGLAECEFEGHFSGGTEYYCADGERKTFALRSGMSMTSSVKKARRNGAVTRKINKKKKELLALLEVEA